MFSLFLSQDKLNFYVDILYPKYQLTKQSVLLIRPVYSNSNSLDVKRWEIGVKVFLAFSLLSLFTPPSSQAWQVEFWASWDSLEGQQSPLPEAGSRLLPQAEPSVFSALFAISLSQLFLKFPSTPSSRAQPSICQLFLCGILETSLKSEIVFLLCSCRTNLYFKLL